MTMPLSGVSGTRPVRRILSLGLVCLMILPKPVSARGGDLDLTFGPAEYPGIVITDFFGGNDRVRAVAIQPDGKLVAAGFAQLSPVGLPSPTVMLARYNSDGLLDYSFGSGGLVFDIAFNFFGSNAVAIQRDGKIVAAGWAAGGFAGTNFALARFESD